MYIVLTIYWRMKMAGKKSRESAIEFLDYLAQKGLMAHATVQARKAAINAVLGILEEQEAQDVTSINLDDVMVRFGNLQGKGYTPQSLVTYKGRVKAALEDFASYVDNPLGLNPIYRSANEGRLQARPRPARRKTIPGARRLCLMSLDPSSKQFLDRWPAASFPFLLGQT